MAADLKQKIQSDISDCAKKLKILLNKYIKSVEDGKQHISLLVAHQTSLNSINTSKIKDTETYDNNPEIMAKLDFNLKSNLNVEEEALELILEQQNVIFSSVMKECDKVSSILRNSKDLGLTLNDLAIGDVNQSPICKKIDAFDTFQRRFNDNHLARRYGLSYYNIGGDVNKLPKLWDTSKIKTIEKNLLDITSR